VHVCKLRRKLSDSSREKDFIKTVRNSGYMFAQPAAFA
jgi:DNA-binding response OmpR family regulator